ncbi:DUF4832 domain-containing protein [Pseudoduganella violaceinigra]|uniref:DUF4832 domain-containing protein n=1 Tax=Pseudoduganella violaceinigra TaxID=246602 RepID=UPI000419B1EA|nr:DUF4832 domain-containing protein [Pseudoduganella violaceinigra]
MPRLNLLIASVLTAASFTPAKADPEGWTALNASRTYTAIPLAGDDTVNPLRGYYRWQNQELVPQSEPAKESYRRYYWKDLEPTQGQYDFSAILNDLAAAKSQGRKFAFRVRMMAGYDDNVSYVGAYIVNNANCQVGCGFWADTDATVPGKTYVPDWNDPWLQQRSRALLSALATALGPDNPDIAWIDVGMFGQYGEWGMRSSAYANPPAGITAISNASKREFAKMHFDAFPSQQHVMFIPYSNKDTLNYALLEQTITARPVGLRADCLSRYGYFDQWTNRPAEWAAFGSQWQKAPVVSEFCPFTSGDPQNNPATARQQAAAFHITLFSNGNFETSRPDSQRWGALNAAEQNELLMMARESGYRYAPASSTVKLTTSGALTLTTMLRNDGSAPTYETWKVNAELVNSAGALVWSGQTTANLKSLTGGGNSASYQDSWTLPALPAGDYTLRLAARDTSASPRAPLKWTINERASDGTLAIATLHRH